MCLEINKIPTATISEKNHLKGLQNELLIFNFVTYMKVELMANEKFMSNKDNNNLLNNLNYHIDIQKRQTLQIIYTNNLFCITLTIKSSFVVKKTLKFVVLLS